LTGLLLSALLTGLLMTTLSGLLTGLLLSAAALLTGLLAALSRLLAWPRVPAAALLPALTALLATTLILLAGTLFFLVHDHSLRRLPTRRQHMRRRSGSRCAAGMTVGRRTNDDRGERNLCARGSRLARRSRRRSMAVGTVRDAEAIVLKRLIAAGAWPAGRAAIERWPRWRGVGAIRRSVGTVLRFLLGARIAGLRRERAHRDCSNGQGDNGSANHRAFFRASPHAVPLYAA
jgi:hypothetical protein